MRYAPSLTSLPIARPLLDEGGHAFLLVLGPEQAVEQPALEADALSERHLERRIDHFLDRNRRERRHGRNALGHLERFLDKARGGNDAGDKARTLGFLRIHHPAGEAHVHRLRLSNRPGHALRSAHAWADAELDFRLAELG